MGGRQEGEINIRTNKITELITECLRKDLRTPACLFFFFPTTASGKLSGSQAGKKRGRKNTLGIGRNWKKAVREVGLRHKKNQCQP